MKLKKFEYAVAVAVLALVAGCGGGGGGGGGSATTPPPAGSTPPATPGQTDFTVGGTVTGLRAGATVTLANGADTLPIGANGSFAFPTTLKSGAAYDIKVTPPGGYTCKATGASGAVGSANVAAAVDCAPNVLAGVVGSLQEPVAVTSDGKGTVYVLDAGLHGVQKLDAAGALAMLAGGTGQPGLADGSGSAARFWLDGDDNNGATVDSQGNLFIMDGCNGAIRKMTSAGVVTTLAGNGTTACYNVATPAAKADGTGAAARFEKPTSMASDGAGGVIVIDANAGLTVRRVNSAGVVVTTTYANPDPSQPTISLRTITRAENGTVYISDANNRIWRDVNGSLVLHAGSLVGGSAQNGTGASARFVAITGMTTTPNGDLYVSDFASVRKVTPSGVVTTLAGSATRGDKDGLGIAAEFGNLLSIGFDGTNLFVVDSGQEVLRRITLDGAVTTVAATPAVRKTINGDAGTARFGSFSSLAADAEGNLYFVDPVTHVLRKATPAGVVTTVAGVVGSAGLDNGPVATAKLAAPTRVATGRDGSIWVAQSLGLRRIKDGAVTTANASVRPIGVAIDNEHNAIVVTGAGTGEVLRVTPAGVTTKLVDKAQIQALVGANANFVPQSVAVDAAGNIYIADTGTVAVYKLTPGGALSVFAGTPFKETGNIDGAVNVATLGFYEVDHLAIDEAGNLYLSGSGNVRKISSAGVVSTPSYVWGKTPIGAITYNKGKLIGMTRYAVVQQYVSP